MALTPETRDALSQALTAVVEECGDDPQYQDLVEKLTGATDALESIADAPEGDGEPDAPDMEKDDAPAEPAPEGEPDGDEADQPGPPDNFADAEKALAARNKRNRELRK